MDIIEKIEEVLEEGQKTFLRKGGLGSATILEQGLYTEVTFLFNEKYATSSLPKDFEKKVKETLAKMSIPYEGFDKQLERA